MVGSFGGFFDGRYDRLDEEERVRQLRVVVQVDVNLKPKFR